MKLNTRALIVVLVGALSLSLIGASGVESASAEVQTTESAFSAVTTASLSASIPTISGVAAVGQTLTALPGVWTSGTTFKYQWYRGTAKISGASHAVRKLTSADKGHAIKVKVTGAAAGYASVSKSSAATAKVASHALKTAVPTITGTLVVGTTVSADPGSWTGGSKFKYQWYRSGASLSGQTASTYTVVFADDGASLSVRVTGSKSGYATQSVSSASSATFGPSTLASGQTLLAGQDMYSPSKQYRLNMQTDGNLVEYNAAGTALWSTSTGGANHVVMQSDGNLVVYPSSGSAVWNSGSAGYSSASLSMQDDGNLVIYQGGSAVWAKNVVGWITVANGATSNGASGTQSMSTDSLNGTQYKVYSPGTRLPIVCGVTDGEAVDGAGTPGTSKDSTWHRTLWGDWVADADFVTGTNGLFSGEPDCNGGSGGSSSNQTGIAAFVQKYNGSNSVPATAGGAGLNGQCTALVTQYVAQVFGYTISHFGNAVTWAGVSPGSDSASLAAHGFTWHSGTSGLEDGDIVVWESGAHYAGSAGHIGIWYQGDVFSQNSYYNNAAHNTTANGNGIGYVGFDNDPSNYYLNGLLGYWRHS